MSDCYCDMWDHAPKLMRGRGYTPGHCATCSVCGDPGHVDASRLGKVTALCDRHRRRPRTLAVGAGLSLLITLLAWSAWAG